MALAPRHTVDAMDLLDDRRIVEVGGTRLWDMICELYVKAGRDAEIAAPAVSEMLASNWVCATGDIAALIAAVVARRVADRRRTIEICEASPGTQAWAAREVQALTGEALAESIARYDQAEDERLRAIRALDAAEAALLKPGHGYCPTCGEAGRRSEKCGCGGYYGDDLGSMPIGESSEVYGGDV